jgi:hypothetical protein
MSYFPDACRELVGKQILIVNNNGFNHLKNGQIYTVSSYRSKNLGIKEMGGRYWSCANNSSRKLFQVLEGQEMIYELKHIDKALSPLMDDILLHLERLEDKLS